MTYVEYGVECTLEYGDIDARFYDSMESMLRKSLEDMKSHDLLNTFKGRFSLIHKKTENMGWGFGDAISDLFEEFYPDNIGANHSKL